MATNCAGRMVPISDVTDRVGDALSELCQSIEAAARVDRTIDPRGGGAPSVAFAGIAAFGSDLPKARQYRRFRRCARLGPAGRLAARSKRGIARGHDVRSFLEARLCRRSRGPTRSYGGRFRTVLRTQPSVFAGKAKQSAYAASRFLRRGACHQSKRKADPLASRKRRPSCRGGVRQIRTPD